MRPKAESVRVFKSFAAENRHNPVNPRNPQFFFRNVAAEIERRRIVSRLLSFFSNFKRVLGSQIKKFFQATRRENFIKKKNVQVNPFCCVAEIFEKRGEIRSARINCVRLQNRRLKNQDVHKSDFIIIRKKCYQLVVKISCLL